MMVITVALLSILCVALVSGCPDWYLETGGECECRGLSDYSTAFAVLCNQDEKRIGIHMGYCVTFDYDRQSVLYGYCPYMYSTNMSSRLYSSLPDDPTLLNETVCSSYNRQGLLCGN